jgi:hypothetical protein
MRHFYYNPFRTLTLVCLILATIRTDAQLLVNTSPNATALVNEIVGPGVTISNVTLQSASDGTGIFSAGGTTNIGLANGILLTTGNAVDAIGPNTAGNTSRDKIDFTPDPNLVPWSAYSIQDQCILEFDFVGQGNFIFVQYVFASEEYNEWVCTQYNDIFGFFVTGPNPTGGNYIGQNVAVIPNTNLPVSVNAINNGSIGSNGNLNACESLSYPNLFVNNTGGTTIGYDGFTTILSAGLSITPGETYHFKFAIADISDGLWDSGIFIKADSFSSYNCEVANLNFESTPPTFCSDDNIPDNVQTQIGSVAPGNVPRYIITNQSGQILDINTNGDFNLGTYGTGIFSIYGIGTTGMVSGLVIGGNVNNISASPATGCFAITSPLTVERRNCTPQITCPENVNVQCFTEVPLPNPAAVTVGYQRCNGGNTVWLNDNSSGNQCNGSIIRTYLFTDSCGYTAQCQQTIIHHDNTLPILTGLPSNGSVACSAMPVGSDYSVSASDNCDATVPVTSTYSDVTSGCNVTRTITWTAADDCDNTTSASRTFTSNDNVAPTLIGVPANASMQCGQTVPEAVVSAIDNCDDNVIVSLNATTVPAACGYSLVRTWTATDACGNTTSASQTTTFVDTTAPVLVGLPNNTSVDCGAVPTGNSFNVTTTDNCVNGVTVTSSFVDNGSGCNIQRVITWTATDACGNSVSASRTFTVTDTTQPVLAGLPSAATVACSALPVGADYGVSASDNCDASVPVTSTYSDATSGCNIVRRITWSAVDDCGNATSASRTFSSDDTVAPTLIGVPADATMQCGQTVPEAVVSAIDNCDANVIVSLNATTVPAACGYSLVRRWTATDACGNTTSALQTITFEDTIDPVIAGLPDNATVACGNLPAGDNFIVSATDNCINGLNVIYEYSDSGSGCNIQRVITWTATDACGNSVSASRTFTTEDNIDPVLAGLPQNGNVMCGGLPSSTEYFVSASDNCDSNVEITVTASVEGLGCNVVRTITWTATDDCGNSTSATRTFTTQDNTAPTMVGVPADAVMQCGQNVPNAVVEAIDNCDTDVTISFETVTVPAQCGYSLVRKWTAVDDCGNTTSASQTTTFEDTTDPVLVGLPDNSTYQCGLLPSGDDFVVTASDNCTNGVTITTSYSEAGVGCHIHRTIIWTATDECGNTASESRLMRTEDTMAPELNNLPVNIQVACGQLPLPSEFNVTAMDNCDTDVTISSTYSDAGSGCNITRTIVWSATDDCGNTSEATRSFTTEDNEAPIFIGVPADAILACGQSVPEAVVFAYDNCDSEVVVAITANTTQLSCGYQFIRTWEAIDDCGNIASASQITTFEDQIAPVLSNLPDGGNSPCGQLPSGDDFAVNANDNCSQAVVISVDHADQGSGCNVVRIITWTATDACGNIASASREFHAFDETMPVLSGIPASYSTTCDAVPPPAAVTASDDCLADLQVVFSEQVSEGCPYTVTRTWSTTDNCGNTASATQIITVTDNIAPVIYGNFEDLTIECHDIIPAADVWAIDNCDANVMVTLSANTETDGCMSIFTRTWTTMDACGNTATASQSIYIVDETEPVFSSQPENMTVSCNEIPQVEELTATDNCNNAVEILFSESVVGSGCPYMIKRNWSAMDDCGNTSEIAQIITVMDNEAPQFLNLPSEINLSCNEIAGYLPIATDACSGAAAVMITSEQNVPGDCGGDVIRTYEATDICGNTTAATQVIHITDNEAPVFSNVPFELFIQCGTTIPEVSMNITAADNCSPDVNITFNQSQTGQTCPYNIIRTWTATDACGNVSVASQTIHIIQAQEATVYMNAYPNPSSNGRTKIQFSVPVDAAVEGGVYDVSGRLVHTLMTGKASGGMVYEWTSETLNLGAGTYFFNMSVNGKPYMKQFIIMNR